MHLIRRFHEEKIKEFFKRQKFILLFIVIIILAVLIISIIITCCCKSYNPEDKIKLWVEVIVIGFAINIASSLFIIAFVDDKEKKIIIKKNNT